MDCLRRVRRLDRLTTDRLVRVGGFGDLYGGRRRWLLRQLPGWFAKRDELELPMPLWEAAGESTRVDEEVVSSENQEVDDSETAAIGEPRMLESPLAMRLADEYELLGVGTSGHWMELLRSWAEESGYIRSEDVASYEDVATVVAAGLLIRPHRPPTKSGRTVVFFTLEVEGVVQRRGGDKPQLVVNRVWSLVSER